MSQIIASFLLCLSMVSICWAENNYTSLKYSLRPIIEAGGKIKLEVKATYFGQFDGGAVALNLPNNWANKEYHQQVQNVRVFFGGRDAKRMSSKQKNQLLLTPTADGFTVIYDLVPAKVDSLDVYGLIIRPDLIHSNGYGLFALPDDLPAAKKLICEIAWQNLPVNWRYSSSHGNELSYTRRLRRGEILHSGYIAGDIRLSQIHFGKTPIYLSLYGQLPLADQEIFMTLQKIVKSQNDFWPDLSYPHYLISLVGTEQKIGMAGTRLNQSFVAHLSPGFDIHDYKILLAHEFLHNWIGGKIVDATKDQQLQWFTEGFTDYYSRVLMFRSNSLNYNQFIGETNELLVSYYMSPVINMPNNQILSGFWYNKAIQKLPYYRGFVFAIYLNHLIKQKDGTKSLDDLMLHLLQASKYQGLTYELFTNLLQRYIDQDAKAIIDNYIIKGETINLTELTVKYPIALESIGEYELGFELEAMLKRRRIKNVIPSSNAYKVGLRNGEFVYGWSLRTDKDPSQTVIIHKKAKIVKFKPQSNTNRLPVFQFEKNSQYQQQLELQKFFGK